MYCQNGWPPEVYRAQLMQKGPTRDLAGRPMVTPTNASNPWWSVFEQAIISAGGKLAKPEILSSTTDSRFIRQLGIPALGFSPMTNTPILLHDNNEVNHLGLLLFNLGYNVMLKLRDVLNSQFLEDKVFLRGIKVYEHIIRALSSFKGWFIIGNCYCIKCTIDVLSPHVGRLELQERSHPQRYSFLRNGSGPTIP